ASARACLSPMAGDDAVIPVFSSGQWAGTVQKTHEALGSDDLIFLSGGGILGHPDGPKAGVESLREAWAAVAAGEEVTERAKRSPALARAFAFFGK
ncbi:ribulose 1,5-bisphosphate carboxylase, partial [Herbaspirillum sp. HC18]